MQEDSDADVGDAIARRLMRAGPEDLSALAASFGDRLLVNTARNLVVVQGGCSGDAFTKLVPVSALTVETLSRLGVGSLTDFLETSPLLIAQDQ